MLSIFSPTFNGAFSGLTTFKSHLELEEGLTVNKKTILKALKVKNSKFTYHSKANKNLIKLAVSWKSLLQHGSRTPWES